MKIMGKCKIANKFIDNKPAKDQFEFENKGKFGIGKLTWTDSGKDKAGDKVFKTSTKKFICFGANIDFIEQNIDKDFEIEGNLVSESFKGQDGKNVKYDQIVLNAVGLFVKEVDKHSQEKGNAFQQDASGAFIDDNINDFPF